MSRDDDKGSGQGFAAPLRGVRVVDLGQYIAGPGAAMALAELGAEVIKIEPIAGEQARHIGRYGQAMIRAYNRGKRSIALDLRSPRGREAAMRLVAGSDVMVFSDNVPVEQELALKTYAAGRDLLVMGPDCGTAVVGGVGLGFATGMVFNPQDTWGIGYAHMDLASGDKEHIAEGYYNFELTQRLRLSLSLQHVLNTPGTESKFGYLLPGIRLQATF